MTDTTFSLAQILPAMPELYLTAAVCVLLLFDVFFGLKAPGRTASFTLVLLLGGALVTLATADVHEAHSLFSGMYIADNLATLLKLAAFLFVAVALYYSGDYLSRRRIHKGEYYVLSLTALLGILVMASAGSLLTVYIGVELLSLSLYALVAFDRENGVAAEAAMKYFVLGAIASGTLLYGMSLVYGMTGSLSLDILASAVAGEASLGLLLGLTFIVVAIGFKFGAVPFHMWVPDVYQGAPTPVTLLVATAPKLASFALAFRVLSEGLAGQVAAWSQMIAVLAVVSLVLGNIVAIAQTNLRRMLAYSAISNVGFILLGFVTGTADGYQASLYFTLVYVLTTLGTFGAILLGAREGFEADEIDQYKGLSRRDPLLALVMAALMFSTAGVPPFVGFWAKLRVLESLVAGGHAWLAGVGVLMSVVGAFYYLRIVWMMYFEAPGDLPGRLARPQLRLMVVLNAAAALALGLLPDALLDVCRSVIPL
ncbi:MAG: NADH-quinone oxidoreductase subunit [Pseudomonadota bacterium]|jgi:NADH-quinone oxidoreductase subunit N